MEIHLDMVKAFSSFCQKRDSLCLKLTKSKRKGKHFNKNNKYQWQNLVESICQGDIYNYLSSNFWEDYVETSSACEKALLELEEEVDKIVSKIPCD